MIFLAALAFACLSSEDTFSQDETRDWSMPERAVIQRLNGQWKCETMIRAGQERAAPDGKLIALSFDEKGMKYFGDVLPQPQPQWTIERITPDSSRVDLVSEFGDRTYRQSLVHQDGKVYVYSTIPASDKLPAKLEVGEECHVLVMTPMKK